MASILERARDAVTERLGVSVVPTERLNTMQEEYTRAHAIVEDAEEMAYHALGYFSGRPVEMVFERRQRLAQRSRIAFWQDPLAGRTTDLYADFSLGNGISIPRANEEEVQKVIDRAWKDPKNEEVLTSFDAQRSTSNTLRTQANVFLAAYIRGGRIRCTWLDADQVRDVVPDPEDELRPLYYIGLRRVFKWNVEEDRPEFEELLGDTGKPKVTYYRHWRNVEDAEEERAEEDGLEPLPVIPDEKKAPGDPGVLHVRTNRLERQHFGIPVAARTMRFHSAMNQFTEARVSKALAAAAFVAKRVIRGGQTSITKAAGSILQQVGELSTGEWRGELGGAPVSEPYAGDPRGQPAPPPGSWWAGNQGDQLESLDLKSGGGEAQADAQIIRAPVSTEFGQHYLGDASNANLATSTSLELPALMLVQAWQELLESIYRWFTDRAIEAAVQAGELGGVTERDGHPKHLDKLRISEADDRAEMERRTGTDLGYKFEMPYPGRRNLPDVTTAVQNTITMAQSVGMAESETLMESVLDFLYTHGFQATDSTEIVERIMEEWKRLLAEQKAEQQRQQEMADERSQLELEQLRNGGSGPAGANDSRSGDGPGRASPAATGDMGESWIPRELRKDITGFVEDSDDIFATLVLEPARIAALAMNGASEPRT